MSARFRLTRFLLVVECHRQVSEITLVAARCVLRCMPEKMLTSGGYRDRIFWVKDWWSYRTFDIRLFESTQWLMGFPVGGLWSVIAAPSCGFNWGHQLTEGNPASHWLAGQPWLAEKCVSWVTHGLASSVAIFCRTGTMAGICF